MNRLKNRNTGIAGLALGVLLAILGVFFWLSGHGLRGPVLLGVGVILLAVGVYALMSSSKTT